jgi:hypothetical protein
VLGWSVGVPFANVAGKAAGSCVVGVAEGCAVSVRMPTMLWKYGVVRMPPFHQVSKPMREIAPRLPSRSSRRVIASPSRFTPRIARGSMFGFTGSSNGGTKIRAGNGADWC